MFQMANEFSFMRYPILFNGVEKKKKMHNVREESGRFYFSN